MSHADAKIPELHADIHRAYKFPFFWKGVMPPQTVPDSSSADS